MLKWKANGLPPLTLLCTKLEFRFLRSVGSKIKGQEFTHYVFILDCDENFRVLKENFNYVKAFDHDRPLMESA